MKLSDLLTVLVPGCGVIGAFIGLLFKATSNREIANNITLGFSLGGIAGTAIAFAIWIGAVAGGA